MQPLRCAHAPSSSLLRFLRSQSEGGFAVLSNPRTLQSVDHTVLRGSYTRQRIRPRGFSNSARLFSTAATGCQTRVAGCPDYDSLRLAPPAKIQLLAAAARTHSHSLKRLPILIVRNASTASRGWTWNPWARNVKQRGQAALKPDDLPRGAFPEDPAETSMFSIGRTMSAKAANEPKLRCTEFDENGNVVLVNGEFKKSELIAKYGLLPRDLRKIDSSLLPHILVRPSAILINLLHLRCLIKHNRVLVFDAYGSTDSYTQSVFMYDLEGKLRQKAASASAGGLPYEFRALEAVLISVTSGLEAEFEGVREPVVRVLQELEEDIDRDKLRYLLIYSKKLSTFEQKAKLVRDAIDELLEADDDLAAMYLTEKAHDLVRGEDDHTEVEMLLESYHKICDEIVQASGNLVSNIRNTEEIVKAILDANRNALMVLGLKFSIGTLGIGSGAFIAALYGMNLKNFIEESDFGFWGVTGWCSVFAAVVVVYGMRKLQRVQRVSMWGEDGRRGRRGSWRNLDDGLRDAATSSSSSEKRQLLLQEAGRKERISAEKSQRLKDEKMAAWKEKVGGKNQIQKPKETKAV